MITLGIIGVVAAMTLPALVGHYKKVETSSRLKKFVSTMEQAIRFGEMEHGDSRDWVKVGTQYDADGDIDYEAQGRVSKEFFLKYLAPYFKYTSITDGENLIDEDGNKSGTATAVHLADGSIFRFNNGACMDVQFDTNGYSKPNKMGYDRFVFFLCFSPAARRGHCGIDKRAFCAIKYSATDRNALLQQCKTQPYWCSGLLEHDNWEFKDDYPYKL